MATINQGSSGLKFKNPLGNSNGDIFTLANSILEFVIKLGAAIVVFFVIYSGFLFVKAQGDPAKLEVAKKTFLWTVIGGVILLGARVLAEVVKNVANDLGAGIV